MLKFYCATNCIHLYLHPYGEQGHINQCQKGNSIWKEFHKFITSILHSNSTLLTNSMDYFREIIYVIKREIHIHNINRHVFFFFTEID